MENCSLFTNGRAFIFNYLLTGWIRNFFFFLLLKKICFLNCLDWKWTNTARQKPFNMVLPVWAGCCRWWRCVPPDSHADHLRCRTSRWKTQRRARRRGPTTGRMSRRSPCGSAGCTHSLCRMCCEFPAGGDRGQSMLNIHCCSTGRYCGLREGCEMSCCTCIMYDVWWCCCVKYVASELSL